MGANPLNYTFDSLEDNLIVFSQRGNKELNATFLSALETARENFEKRTGIKTYSTINIRTDSPHNDACLHIIDYYLWAIYRLFANQEDRYFELLKADLNWLWIWMIQE